MPYCIFPQNFMNLFKSISEDTIWKQGTGYFPQLTNLTVTVKAFGDTSIKQIPVDVYFIIDHSGSMDWWDKDPNCTPGSTRLDYAHIAARAFVDSLTPSDRAAILYFWGAGDQSNWKFQPLTSNKNTLNTFLNDQTTGGGTGLREAIVQAADYMKATPHGGRSAVIITLTDGAQCCGNAIDTSVALSALTSAYNNGIKTYAIGLGSDETYELDMGNCTLRSAGYDFPFLMQVARHGQNDYVNNPPRGYYASPTGADLTQIYLEIARAIQSSVALQLASGEHMILDSMHSYIRYNSWSKTANNTTTINSANTAVISWDVDDIKVDSTFEVVYSIASVQAGYQPTNVASRSVVQYLDPISNLRKELYFPQTFVYVMDTLNSSLIRIENAVPIDHQQITVIIDTTNFKTKLAVDSIVIYYGTTGFITNLNNTSRRSFPYTGATRTFIINSLTENTLYYFTLSVRNSAGHRSALIGDFTHGDTARTLFQIGKPAKVELVYYPNNNLFNSPINLQNYPVANPFLADSSQWMGARVTDAYGNLTSFNDTVRFSSNSGFLGDIRIISGFSNILYYVPLGQSILSAQIKSNSTIRDSALIQGDAQGARLALLSSNQLALNGPINAIVDNPFPLYFHLLNITSNQPLGRTVNLTLVASDVANTQFSLTSIFTNPLPSGTTLNNFNFSNSSSQDSVRMIWVRNFRIQNNLEITASTTVDNNAVQGSKNDIFILPDSIRSQNVRIVGCRALDHQSIEVTLDTTDFKRRWAVDSIALYFSTSSYITNLNDPSHQDYIYTATTDKFVLVNLSENTLYYMTLSVSNPGGNRSALIAANGDTCRTLFQIGKAAGIQMVYFLGSNQNALLDYPTENFFISDTFRTLGATVTDAYGNSVADGTLITFSRLNGEFLRDVQTLGGVAQFQHLIRFGLDTLKAVVTLNPSIRDSALIRGEAEGFRMVLTSNTAFPINDQRITVSAGTLFPVYLFLLNIRTDLPQDQTTNVIFTASDPVNTTFSLSSTFASPFNSGTSVSIHFSANTQAESIAVIYARCTRAQNNLQLIATTTINNNTIQGKKGDIFIVPDSIQFIRVVKRQPATLDFYSVADSLKDTTLYLDQTGWAQLPKAVYAAGYDRYGNFNRLVNANWTSNEPRFGVILNSATNFLFRTQSFGQGRLLITFNTMTSQSGIITVKDQILPSILQAWTKDSNGDGFLDQIGLIVSEGVRLDYSVQPPGSAVTITGKTDRNIIINYTLDSIQITGRNDLVILFVHSPNRFTDTDVLPSLTIAAGIPTMIQDSSANWLNEGVFAGIVDSAGPVIDSALFDNNSTEKKTDDYLKIFFSEKVVAAQIMNKDSAHTVFRIDNANSSVNKLTGKKTEFIFNPTPSVTDLTVSNSKAATLQTELVIIPTFDYIQIISSSVFSFMRDAVGNLPHPSNRRVEIRQIGSGNPLTDFFTYPNPLIQGKDIMHVSYNLWDTVKEIQIHIFSKTGERIKSYNVMGTNVYGYGDKYKNPNDKTQGLKAPKSFALWDGTNENGRWVEIGIYICKLHASFESGQQVDIAWKVGITDLERQ